MNPKTRKQDVSEVTTCRSHCACKGFIRRKVVRSEDVTNFLSEQVSGNEALNWISGSELEGKAQEYRTSQGRNKRIQRNTPWSQMHGQICTTVPNSKAYPKGDNSMTVSPTFNPNKFQLYIKPKQTIKLL